MTTIELPLPETNDPVAAEAPAEQKPQNKRVDSLRPIYLRSNYKLGKIRLPHWTVYHLGARIEEVVEQMIVAIRRDTGGSLQVGWAAEHDNQPGISRPLRVVSTLHPLHRVAIDMIFCAEGPDLYVRFELVTRSWLTYLKFALFTSSFAALFIALYGLFYMNTGVYKSLALEFARKAPTQDSGLAYAKYTSGAFGERWTLLDFLRDDPKLFLTTMGGPPTIIAGAIGLLLYKLPREWMRFPCKWLKWPNPNTFKNHATQFAVRMDRTFSMMLGNVYSVFEPTGCRRIESE